LTHDNIHAIIEGVRQVFQESMGIRMTHSNATPQVYGVIGTPVYDYEGGIRHFWNDPESVLEMSLKLATQNMGEEGSDPSVQARVRRAYRLAQEGEHGPNQYLHNLHQIFARKGL
jgi:hypothetical protein